MNEGRKSTVLNELKHWIFSTLIVLNDHELETMNKFAHFMILAWSDFNTKIEFEL